MAENKLPISACLDCKAPVATGILDGEFVIIHTGEGCDGFRQRFSRSSSTKAMNEKGETVSREPSRKSLPAKTEKTEKTEKTDDKK